MFALMLSTMSIMALKLKHVVDIGFNLNIARPFRHRDSVSVCSLCTTRLQRVDKMGKH